MLWICYLPWENFESRYVRIGNIGDVHEEDINRLVDSIAKGTVIG